jgi:hypothetical protein
VHAAEREHLAGHREAHLAQVGRTTPCSTSTASATSSALPMPRPSGASSTVSRHTVRMPASAPSRTIVAASSRAVSRSFMNAPAPTLTSSSTASAPPAIFLLMMLLAMSGIDSTVAVTSRRA